MSSEDRSEGTHRPRAATAPATAAPPPRGEEKSAAATPFNSPSEAPRVRMAPISPLLADHDWICGFRVMVDWLLDTGHAVIRHGSMPGYRATLIETEWKPRLDGLKAHIMKAVEDGRNGPPIRTYVLDGNIERAYQLVCGALDEAADPTAPNEPMMSALEEIADRLSHWQAPAGSAPPPQGDVQAPVVPGDEKKGPVLVNRNGNQPTVTLEDGVCYVVTPEGAAVVDILIRNAPRTITYSEMTQLDSVLEHQCAGKIGRDVIDKLPEPIRSRIKREPGKGCTWLDGLADPDSVL
jgi:hypothetical protein